MNAMLLVIVGGFALVGVVAYFSYQADKKRRAMLLAYAQSNGWTYTARDDSWCDRFSGSPFGEGDDRTASNILQGPYDGTSMVAFDYSYETSSTDSKGNRSTTTHRFVVCAVRMPC